MSDRDEPVDLTVPPVDQVLDLHGDPCEADLVLFVNGNQFMAMDEVVAAFRAGHPDVEQVFFETVPPGKLVQQTRHGRLRVGNLVLSVRPDVVAAGPAALEPLVAAGLVEPPRDYAHNDLAILVAAGNPLGVHGWADLARPEVRIAMPNLQFEGVAQLIASSLQKAGGAQLRDHVFETKVADGSTRFTAIHHRQSAAWLQAGEVDACPLWTTEALHHCREAGSPFETVTIPAEHNTVGRYTVAVVQDCPHPDAARRYVDFVVSGGGGEVYRRYGFGGPLER